MAFSKDFAQDKWLKTSSRISLKSNEKGSCVCRSTSARLHLQLSFFICAGIQVRTPRTLIETDHLNGAYSNIFQNKIYIKLSFKFCMSYEDEKTANSLSGGFNRMTVWFWREVRANKRNRTDGVVPFFCFHKLCISILPPHPEDTF